MEIRRSLDRRISTMGFPILVRCHLCIESGPWLLKSDMFPSLLTLAVGTCDIRRHIIMMVADVLVPNRFQVISNDHDDLLECHMNHTVQNTYHNRTPEHNMSGWQEVDNPLTFLSLSDWCPYIKTTVCLIIMFFKVHMFSCISTLMHA